MKTGQIFICFLFALILLPSCDEQVPLHIININETVASIRIGDHELYLLSEGDQKGSSSILIGATDEMLEECTPAGTFPNACNAFVLKAGADRILFDTGFGRRLIENLNTVYLTAGDINHLFITHLHGDHIGGMLKDGSLMFPNAKVYISKMEYDYWMDEERTNNATQKRVIEAYRDKIVLFEPSSYQERAIDVIPGVSAISSYGHTPGHVSFLISSKSSKLLIWGDLTHAMAIQMPYPEVAVTYDIDPVMAIQSRKEILEFITKNKLIVAGMHIAYPGIGRITPRDSGGYSFSQ